MDTIQIRGARTHNLKNIDLDLPRDKLIVMTGLSGSGKSSLAFDTIYAEGQRRYVESLSAYARQFLSMMEKPDVDHIEGLSPAISIEQKSTSHNPRSTVGTITEIYDYLRLLYARVGTPHCPEHGTVLEAQTISQMVDHVLSLPEGSRLMLLAPVVDARKGEHVQVLEELRAHGFVRARIDGEVVELDQPPKLDLRRKHVIEAVVDRFKVREELQLRLAESFETALNLSDGTGTHRLDGQERPGRAVVLGEVCLRAMRLLDQRTGAATVFLQQPCRRLPGMRRSRGTPVLRCRARGRAPGTESHRRRRARLGSPQRLLFPADFKSLAEHYGFDLETPFEDLPDDIQDIILHGSKGEQIDFTYLHERRGSVVRRHPFEGIITQHETPLSRNRIEHGTRRTGTLSQQPDLPGLPGLATQPGRTPCHHQRQKACRTPPRCRSVPARHCLHRCNCRAVAARSPTRC